MFQESVILFAFACFVALSVPVAVGPSVQIKVKEFKFLEAQAMT